MPLLVALFLNKTSLPQRIKKSVRTGCFQGMTSWAIWASFLILLILALLLIPFPSPQSYFCALAKFYPQTGNCPTPFPPWSPRLLPQRHHICTADLSCGSPSSPMGLQSLQSQIPQVSQKFHPLVRHSHHRPWSKFTSQGLISIPLNWRS